MKKIVFLRQNPNASGGAERYLMRLREALEKQGVESRVRFYEGRQHVASWLKALRFNRQVARKKREDEIYFSLERVSSADIYRAGDGVHRVYRATKPHWWLNPLNFVYPKLEKKCFENARLIIANSNLIKRQIIDTYGISEDKIRLIYNGVNLPATIKKGEAKMALCKSLGLNYELPTVLFAGSGFKRKGMNEFLDILAHAKTPCNIVIAGSDKNLVHYRTRARALGLNAVFMGFVKNMSPIYAGSDLLLFPTVYEPFSNVVLEAMSFECAVITTAQNGASEAIESEFTLVSPTDENAPALVDSLLSNPERLREIQLKNALRAKDFSIEKNAELTLEAINACLD